MGAAELNFEKLLTIEQVAKKIGCSIRHVYDEIARGNLKAMKLGKRLKFEQQEVVKWAKRKTR